MIMLKFFHKHWKLWIFFVILIFSVFYFLGHDLFKILGQSQIFGASLTINSNQPINDFIEENPLPAPLPETAADVARPDPVILPAIIQPIYDTQDQIDDLLEKIDLLQRQLADALAKENQSEIVVIQEIEETEKIEEIEKTEIIEVMEKTNEVLPKQNNITITTQSKAAVKPFYPKILISEVQISGADDSKQEFVELYNPNGNEVNLSDWYLQRKTKTGNEYSTFAPNRLFFDKKIAANGYFLIAREDYFTGLANVFADNPLTEDNSLILKNPNGEISDKVGWGAAQDYELLSVLNPAPGQSIGRKIVSEQPYDTDINERDFELNTPTPKAKNTTYIAPEILPPEFLPPEDEMAPEVVFNIEDLQDSLSFLVNFTIIDPIETVSSSGVAGYIFRWKEENNDWQENEYKNVDGGQASFEGLEDFTGNDEKSYYFQIKAKDLKGNESIWFPAVPAETKISILKKIIINEVQTAGATTKDEFIELYNPGSADVDLAGFSLKKKTSGGNESNLVSSGAFLGIIPSLGYFLIAPQPNDDGVENYTGQVLPNLRYSGKTFSIASNNTILIYNKEDVLLDKVGFGTAQDYEASPTENPDQSQSIERKELGIDTDNNADDFRISNFASPGAIFEEVIIPDVPVEVPEETPIETNSDPISEEIATEPLTEPIIDILVEELPSEPIDDPPVETVVEPVIETFVESVVESVAESAVESVVEDFIDQAVIP